MALTLRLDMAVEHHKELGPDFYSLEGEPAAGYGTATMPLPV
jgi:hypothetical protein